MKKAFRFYALILATFSFLVINVQNSSEITQVYSEKDVAEENEFEYTSHAASLEDGYASALNGLEINLHPGTTFNKNSQSTTRSLNHCKSLVYQTLVSLPQKHQDQLDHLTLYFADGRRGLGGGSTVILRCSDVTDKELSSVLVHEVGHLVDTGLFKSNFWSGKSEFMDGKNPVYNNDISLRFYRISWADEESLHEDTHKRDFVSGYAMSDPFEDFAESYNFYTLHGDQFKEMAEYNKKLRSKYLFFKYYVFKGEEFDNDPYNKVNYYTRNYDSTVLNYDLTQFLKS